MRLKKFDGNLVKIIHKDGNIYEGICHYINHEYSFHEFGRDEECLEILNILFYKCEIKKIVRLTKYSKSFGEIEKMIVSDIDILEEVLNSEENVQIYRILLCMSEEELNYEIIKLLEKLLNDNQDKLIRTKANQLIKQYYSKKEL